MAWLHPNVDDSAIKHASETLRITAPVELRPADAMAPLAAVVSQPTTAKILPRGSGPPLVVTNRAATAGTVIHAGDLVAEVSGRPILAIPSSVPLYRDLLVGDRGNDVRLLEKVLAGRGLLRETPDDRATERTRAAVNALLAQSGYPPLTANTVLPLDHTAPVPDGAMIMSAAQVGDAVDAERPLVTVETRGSVISGRADVLSVRFLTPGTTVTVTDGRGRAAKSQVTALSAFREAGTNVPAGQDVSIALPDELSLSVGDRVEVAVAPSSDPQPAVPLSAIRYDGPQTYVLVVDSPDPSAQPRRTDVVVVAQANGFAVLSTSSLPKGTLVVVRT